MPRTGRPKLEKTKLSPLNLRTSPDIRERIERAAEESGRSLTQEVERRLFTSFNFDEVRGGQHINTFANLFCAAIQSVEFQTGKKFTDDFDTFQMARGVVDRLLQWKNPGILTEDEARIEDEYEAAEADLRAAREAMSEFRKEWGYPRGANRGSMFGGMMFKGKPEWRDDWTDTQFEAEAELQTRLNAAENAEYHARRAWDAIREPLTLRIDSREKVGADIAERFFDQLGPR